jgi:hypothetical protein
VYISTIVVDAKESRSTVYELMFILTKSRSTAYDFPFELPVNDNLSEVSLILWSLTSARGMVMYNESLLR